MFLGKFELLLINRPVPPTMGLSWYIPTIVQSVWAGAQSRGSGGFSGWEPEPEPDCSKIDAAPGSWTLGIFS